LFDRPKPTAGCSASGRRRIRRTKEEEEEEEDEEEEEEEEEEYNISHRSFTNYIAKMCLSVVLHGADTNKESGKYQRLCSQQTSLKKTWQKVEYLLKNYKELFERKTLGAVYCFVRLVSLFVLCCKTITYCAGF
jgi:hypothetical protein